MNENVCFNGTLVHTDSYSSPVPFIGVYVAAANLVCSLLIISDLFAGFRRRKSWFPCRFFSLNSITLTLLSVATKIPVDLTTEMPRRQDQLSKLSGTVFICLTMGFMLPSIGASGDFESYANITALSIFVITVAVNICIQIATGLIFSLLIEHYIVLGCMFLLLVRFWLSVVDVNARKAVYTDHNKDLVRKDEQSMLQHLKVCYLHGYNSCPQFLLCKDRCLGHVTLLCVICSVVLLEAVFRSIMDLQFCGGASDYGWSMWPMVATQILTIVVASFAVGSRWLTYFAHVGENFYQWDKLPTDAYLQFLHLFSLTKIPKSLEVIFRFVVYYPLKMVDLFLTTSTFIISAILAAAVEQFEMCSSADDSTKGEFKELLKTHHVVIKQWVLSKGVDDMKSWMEKNKNDPPKHLIKMLPAIPPSSLTTTAANLNTDNQISCLSMLLLVEIAKISTPASEAIALTDVLDDVFEVVHFIDSNINVGSPRNKLRSIYARVLWKFGLIRELVYKEIVKRTRSQMDQSQLGSDDVLAILRRFQDSFTTDIVCDEAREIVKLLHRCSYASNKELCDHIERLFVDMLYSFLAQLPDAIFNHIHESPIEEYEDRVRLGLGYICKFESVKTHMGSASSA